MKKIWFNDEQSYVGATGVNSVEEMAELALEDREILDVFGMDADNVTISDIAAFLVENDVRAERVPVKTFHSENGWDGSQVGRCDFADSPGRGHIKVIGINL